MINKEMVLEGLLKLSLNYQQARHTSEELEELSTIWLKSLVNVSPDVFEDACRLHMEASDYFPTLRNVLDCCSSVWAERRRNIKALPEPLPDLPPEQVKENIENIRAAMRQKPMPVVKTEVKEDLKANVKQRLEKYKDGEK